MSPNSKEKGTDNDKLIGVRHWEERERSKMRTGAKCTNKEYEKYSFYAKSSM